MAELITTLGPKREDELDMILPHEHIFANFPTGDDLNCTPEVVVGALLPEVAKTKAAGVTALVDATAVGGARRADILLALSLAAQLPIVPATGIFKEPWKADRVKTFGQEGLANWMIGELNFQIDNTGVRAGWIKLSVADDGLMDHETFLLRAAAQAGRATQATIGVHTVKGRVAHDQLDVIEQAGYTPERFIWIHTQMEDDFNIHLEIARRGAWIEYDAIGDFRTDEEYINWICRLIDAGFHDHLLLSQDRGWYDPSQIGGGVFKPYTYISDVFLPKLRTAGIDEAIIRQITHTNPFRAYAR
ncbi:MAG: esterase [Anaerolineaceae bacterium]|nr:esterase [Anaerolineaceae bacterium]